MKLVNIELYEFMESCETGLYIDDNLKIRAFAHVEFYELEEFVKIVGVNHFCDGGIEVRMFDSNIVIDVTDIIEGDGHLLSSYEAVFNRQEWEIHKKFIEEGNE